MSTHYFWNSVQQKTCACISVRKLTCGAQVTFNPVPHYDNLWCPWGKSLLETLWERRICLWPACSPFPIRFSTFLKDKFDILSNIQYAVCKCPQFWPILKFCFIFHFNYLMSVQDRFSLIYYVKTCILTVLYQSLFHWHIKCIWLLTMNSRVPILREIWNAVNHNIAQSCQLHSCSLYHSV